MNEKEVELYKFLEEYAKNLEIKLSQASNQVEIDYLLAEQDFFLANLTNMDEYDHRPMSIKEWITSPLGANSEHLLRPKIKEILYDVFEDPERYREIVIDGGIGIGKSFFSGQALAYMLHRLLCLKDPNKYFNFAPGSLIALMNCSISGDQAKKVVFNEVVSSINNCPWFVNNGYAPDPKIRSELRFTKNIAILPGNSSELSFVGFNLYAGIIDEAAWHKVTEEKDYAENAYNQMINRVKSRFNNFGKLFMISSPRYVDDFIERKMRESDSNPKIYAIRVPYWECLPKSFTLSGKSFLFDDVTRMVVHDDYGNALITENNPIIEIEREKNIGETQNIEPIDDEVSNLINNL